MRIRYKDLTERQKLFITNGCGGKGSIISVPNFRFLASCRHHDFQYWLGCTKAQRKKADKQFLVEMLKDAKSVSGVRNDIYFPLLPLIIPREKLTKWFYTFWAYVYYQAVRFRGGKYFHYSPMQKSLEDLMIEMEE